LIRRIGKTQTKSLVVAGPPAKQNGL